MRRILVISNDEYINCFCNKLNERGLDSFTIQCISSISEKTEGKYSVVLIDFELIKSGESGLIDKIYDRFFDSQIFPLVKEKSMGGAVKILGCDNEGIITLPCCVEYLDKCISCSSVSQHFDEEYMQGNDSGVLDNFIGVSQQMIEIKEKIKSVAKNNLPVLILGETGVGKSYIAEYIHKLSDRKNRKFVSENIAAIQENLLEGEMFGTKEGAFTGAVSRKGLIGYANEGTLFLDEIACIKNSIQAKLLDVLESGEYRSVGDIEKKYSDIRLICATNIPANELKESESFRNDLYYRISGIQIYIPELKERKEDIEELVYYFLDKYAQVSGIVKKIRTDALLKLQNHNWPGNVRELKRCVECAFFMSNNSVITARDINFVL